MGGGGWCVWAGSVYGVCCVGVGGGVCVGGGGVGGVQSCLT